jgi:Restriction endonuclease
MADATLIVDCKRWGKPVEIADAGTFIDLVEDVGADVGLLVTTEGASTAARVRLRSARGLVNRSVRRPVSRNG